MRHTYIFIILLIGEICLTNYLPGQSWIDICRNVIIICITSIAVYYILLKLSYILFKDKK